MCCLPLEAWQICTDLLMTLALTAWYWNYNSHIHFIARSNKYFTYQSSLIATDISMRRAEKFCIHYVDADRSNIFQMWASSFPWFEMPRLILTKCLWVTSWVTLSQPDSFSLTIRPALLIWRVQILEERRRHALLVPGPLQLLSKVKQKHELANRH